MTLKEQNSIQINVVSKPNKNKDSVDFKILIIILLLL